MLYIPEPIRILKRKLLRKSEGERFLTERFERLHGKSLDLSNPQTFMEKLYCQMVKTHRGHNPTFTKLADKLSVRAYVKQRIGEKYLTQLFWNGRDPRAIPFDKLPPICIAKTNHGCGRNIVITRDTDRSFAIASLKKWLNENYYWALREAQYYDIPPQILIEEFLDDGQPDGPLDYKFWCFNGVPELLQVDNHTHDINPYYDRNWKRLNIRSRQDFKAFDLPKPQNLDDLIYIAQALSRGIDFVRVDMFNVNERVYAGEMTFSPGAGMFKFSPEYWDHILGEKWI
jgi:hypothetical protein